MSAHLREAWRRTAVGGKLYHLTWDVNFTLDPDFHPENNTTLGGDWPEAGIFVAESIEPWVNGYGYWRPWVVEFDFSGSAEWKGYGGEIFVPASEFGQGLRVSRVLPLDAWCREEFGEWGWTEDHFETYFDTNEPIPEEEFRYPSGGYRSGNWSGYRYSGDARSEGGSWQSYYEKRVAEFARQR